MATAKKKTTKKKAAAKSAQPTVDVDVLREQIIDEIGKRLTAEFDTRVQQAVRRAGQSAEQKRDRITIVGGPHQYSIDATTDGLQFARGEDTLFLVGKAGQLGAGTLAPRTVGKGSAHFKAGASSEAIMPTSGAGSTRGVIVEGDGDDDQTLVFRAVSKVSRQGFNIFSDGSVGIGTLKKINNAKLSVYHRHNDADAVSIDVASRYFEHTALNIQSAAPVSKNWKAIEITADTGAAGETHIVQVDGTGNFYSNASYLSNHNGYAEMFEWADGNPRNEDRVGHTVAINNQGKLISACEGNPPVGVVVPHAAMVGNTAWNHWHRKHSTDRFGRARTAGYEVAEWLEDETTTLKSIYKHSLPADVALPENAVLYQTDSTGHDLAGATINSAYESHRDYLGRPHRKSWAAVCLLGTVAVYKGQTVDNRWITVKSINDELELVLIR
jgi:hypothetical protein